MLSIAVALQKEAEELKVINETYERNISNVLKIQSDLESIRSRKYILGESLPVKPNLNVIIQDIRRSAAEEGITVLSLSVAGIELKGEVNEPGIQPQIIEAKIDIQADYNQLNRFIHNIVNQRRIKTISSLKIDRGKVIGGEQEVKLKLIMNIETYYLPELATTL